MLTFIVVGKTADTLVQIMAVVPNYTRRHSILHSHVLTVRQTKPVSLKNVKNSSKKQSINLNPQVQIF